MAPEQATVIGETGGSGTDGTGPTADGTARATIPPPVPGHPYDLRQFFHAVGHFSGERALTSTPVTRKELDTPAEVIDPGPAQITDEPLASASFIDGVQAALMVTHRAHRPVYLNYAGAGALDRDLRPVGLNERLWVTCSSLDEDWARGLGSNIPIVVLSQETSPPDLEGAALTALANTRAALERHLVRDLMARPAGALVLDGALIGQEDNTRLYGVVKSTNHKYLADESCLFGLRAGWRSPRFIIPAGVAGCAHERYSCYLRLHDATHDRWNFALVRLECFGNPDLLGPLAALCMAERQGPGSGDGRWDRHLRAVRRTEDFLRARRPKAFSLL